MAESKPEAVYYYLIPSEINERVAKEIHALLLQLTPRAPRWEAENLREYAEDKNHVVLIARRDGVIVGVATLHIREDHTLIRTPARQAGTIEDVVVNKNYRGEGIGRELVNTLLGHAKTHGLAHVDLTSKEERGLVTFYKRLGFELKGEATESGTNFFRYTMRRRR